MDLPSVKEGGNQNSLQFRALIKSIAWNYKGTFFFCRKFLSWNRQPPNWEQISRPQGKEQQS